MADTGGIRVPWPGWSVTRRLGSGGFGSVYEIERDIFGRKEKAAMKVVSIPESQSDIVADYSDGYDDKSITEKYRNELQKVMGEYQLMAEMKGHSNLVSCDDYAVVEHTGMIGWDVYIRMELLTPLHAVLQAGNFSVEKVCRLGVDICRALIVCEKKNIIHRDIKPENILVSENGDFKLGDFGIARTMDHTTHATKTGTDRYMAPEVIKGEKYGKTVDIYSLGLVLYWLLNRRRMPFLLLNTAPTADEISRSRARRLAGEALPKPADGNEALKQVVLKACAYRPGDRFADAQSMLNALEAAKTGQTVQTNPASGAGYSGNVAGYGKTVLQGGQAWKASEPDDYVGRTVPQGGQAWKVSEPDDYVGRTVPQGGHAWGMSAADDSSGKSRGNGWADDNDEVSRPGNAWGRAPAEDKIEKTIPAEQPKKPATQPAAKSPEKVVPQQGAKSPEKVVPQQAAKQEQKRSKKDMPMSGTEEILFYILMILPIIGGYWANSANAVGLMSSLDSESELLLMVGISVGMLFSVFALKNPGIACVMGALTGFCGLSNCLGMVMDTMESNGRSGTTLYEIAGLLTVILPFVAAYKEGGYASRMAKEKRKG